MIRPLAEYLRFLCAGLLVGLASVGFLEAGRWIVGRPELWIHGVLVALTYLFGATLSYWLQQGFVFHRRLPAAVRGFSVFFGICIAIAALAGVVAAALLAWPPLTRLFSAFAPAASLLAAALLLSPLSYGATRAFFRWWGGR